MPHNRVKIVLTIPIEWPADGAGPRLENLATLKRWLVETDEGRHCFLAESFENTLNELLNRTEVFNGLNWINLEGIDVSLASQTT